VGMDQGRVLIADDSTAVRSILRRQLTSAGIEVLEASNGQEAVHQARSARPDVVLLDVDMPVLDGFQVLSILRADPATRDLPVLFLTGRVDTAELIEGLDLGAFDYVKKPCDVGELIARVRAALRWKARADELIQLAESLDVAGGTDLLTGLPNRRALVRQLGVLATKARSSGSGLVVAMIDVDHFKRVNDVEGHPAGDAVLQEVARRLRSAIRPGQLLGRWGGEEFLAVSEHLTQEGARRFGERFRTLVAWEPVQLFEDRTLPITVSVGVAAGSPTTDEGLVAHADAALYTAKRSGRDCVVVAPLDEGVLVSSEQSRVQDGGDTGQVLQGRELDGDLAALGADVDLHPRL
jgi:two-component system cell cycle response regulator